MFVRLGDIRALVREALVRRFKPVRRDYEQGRITPGMRFYHASPRRFRHGDVLTGGHGGGYGTEHGNVCMTTSPDPHGTIRSGITGWHGHYDPPGAIDWRPTATRNRDWFVYEVEPLDRVTYVEGNNEYQTRAARVLKNLGRASAILQKRSPVVGTSAALSADRDRDRARKYAERRQRREKRRDDGQDHGDED